MRRWARQPAQPARSWHRPVCVRQGCHDKWYTKLQYAVPPYICVKPHILLPLSPALIRRCYMVYMLLTANRYLPGVGLTINGQAYTVGETLQAQPLRTSVNASADQASIVRYSRFPSSGWHRHDSILLLDFRPLSSRRPPNRQLRPLSPASPQHPLHFASRLPFTDRSDSSKCHGYVLLMYYPPGILRLAYLSIVRRVLLLLRIPSAAGSFGA